jgi:predicted phosphoribosyltransferase
LALFRDRHVAGRALANELLDYRDRNDVVVLGLPHGGVPVAYEIAKSLHTPLDILVVRNIEVPGNRELSMGAIVSGGIRLINYDVVRLLNTTQFAIDAVVAKAQEKIERLERQYRNGWPALEVHDRIVIVVDDGIATGATMRSAVLAIRRRSPAAIVVAVPSASRDSLAMLGEHAEKAVFLSSPEPYISVGRWYEDYAMISDAEVGELLIKATTALCTSSRRPPVH